MLHLPSANNLNTVAVDGQHSVSIWPSVSRKRHRPPGTGWGHRCQVWDADVSMMIIAIPDMTQCSLVDKFKRIVGTCYLHLQGRNINHSRTVDSLCCSYFTRWVCSAAVFIFTLFWSWNVLVGIEPRLRCLTTEQPQFDSRKGQTISSCPQHPDRFCGPPRVLFSGGWELFPRRWIVLELQVTFL